MIPATGQWLEAVNLEQRRELAATPGAHSLSPNARAVHLFHYLARILNCNEQFIYVCRKVFQRQFSILLVHVAKTKGRHQREKTFSFGHCPNDVCGGGSTHARIFGPLSRSAFLVNKKSLFIQKCQCIELLTVF